MPDNLNRKLKREFNRVAVEMHAGKIKAGDVDLRLLRVVGSTLQNAVNEGFGKTFASVDWDTPDGEMLASLTRNAWHFSAAKNYQQIRDMSDALIDENGRARSFADFKTEAAKVNHTYNQKWLKTEYNAAIGASTMAARWSDYQKNADDMPYLQYDTVGDSNVRTEHQMLDDIIRKMIDEFWKQYFPPNGWGCRCSVNQLSTASAIETRDIPTVNVPEMFKTNLAESGLVFPKAHPFFDGIPNNVLKDYIAGLPDDAVYTEVYRNDMSGGSVKMHMYHGRSNPGEVFFNNSQAEYLADFGYNVKLLPDFGNAPDSVRSKYFKKTSYRPRKNPDAMVNNQVMDFKRALATKSSIHNRIKEIAAQSGKGVIWLKEPMPLDKFKQFAKGQLKHYTEAEVDEIWLFTNERDLLKFKRSDFGL